MIFSLFSLFRAGPSSAEARQEPNQEPDTRFVIEKLVLSREKIALPSYVLSGTPDSSGKIKPALLKFTRLRIVVRNIAEEKQVSVIGQRAGTVLRLGAYIASEVEKVPAFLYPNGRATTDWVRLWKSALDATFKEHRDGQWIKIFVSGECVFSSSESYRYYDVMEGLAGGAELTSELVEAAAGNVVGQGNVVPAKYTGQTYLAIGRSGSNYRGAVLDRHDKHNRSLFAYAPMVNRTSHSLKLSRFSNFCADVLDALTIRTTIAGMQGLPTEQRETHSDFLLEAAEFQKKTLARIVGFERSQHVVFRPERPDFD